VMNIKCEIIFWYIFVGAAGGRRCWQESSSELVYWFNLQNPAGAKTVSLAVYEINW